MRMPDGTEILVTSMDGSTHALPIPGEPFLVGLHAPECCDQLGIWTMTVGATYSLDAQPTNEG